MGLPAVTLVDVADVTKLQCGLLFPSEISFKIVIDHPARTRGSLSLQFSKNVIKYISMSKKLLQ